MVAVSFSPDSINRKMAKLGVIPKNGKFDVSHLIKIRVNQSHMEAAQLWCQQNYQDDWVWSNPIHTDYSDFYFMHEQDALAFRLRFESTTA